MRKAAARHAAWFPLPPELAGFEGRLTNTSFTYNLDILGLVWKKIPAPVWRMISTPGRR
jgi:hypothetical protein